MIVENQLVEMLWAPKTRKYYENLGYVFTKIGDKFYIDPTHLPNTSSKIVKVQCDYCGEIFETSYAHYNRSISDYHKTACKSCSGKKRVEKSLKKRQNEMYDKLSSTCNYFNYKLLTDKKDLINNTSRIKYICPRHGEQETTVTGLLQHKQCKKCASEIRKEKTKNRWEKSLKDRQDKMYSQCLEVCNKLGYKLLSSKGDIKNCKTYVQYECPRHGVHSIRINNLLSGKKCPECRIEKAKDTFSFTPDEVYNKVKSLGGDLLNKDDYINQDEKNLKILCPNCHETIFTTSFKHFRQHGGQSCPICRSKESVGERRIRQWLECNNIEYVQEKWFPDCRDVHPLPFDFYLPNNNTIIEFDGKQHFDETHFFQYNLKNNSSDSLHSYIKRHDEIKNNYCISKNISLIRIPYTKINSIETILEEKLIA